MSLKCKPMVHTVNYDGRVCNILTIFDRPVSDDFWFYVIGTGRTDWEFRIIMRLVHEGRFTSEPLSLSGLTILDFDIDYLLLKHPDYQDAVRKLIVARIEAVAERDATPIKKLSKKEAAAFVDQFLKEHSNEK